MEGPLILGGGKAERAGMLGAVLLAFASRLAYCFHRGLGAGVDHLFDDALITLRYARNLAAGLGLVYNPGDAFLGTSSPLYAMLMALPIRLGADPIWSAVLGNAAGDAAVCVLLVRLGRGFPFFQVLAPFFFLLQANILYWSGTGMEFSLLVLLTFGTIALFAAGRHGWAGAAAAAAVVGRLDALIVLAGFAAVALRAERRLPWRFAAAFAAVSAPWWIYALAAYGDVVPLSARARYLLYPAQPWSGEALELVLRSPWLLPAALGAWLAWRGAGGALGAEEGPRRFFLRALSLHPPLFALAYEATGGTLYRRYQVALEASLVVLGCAGLAFLLGELLRPGADGGRRRRAAAAALAIAALFLAYPTLGALRYPWQRLPPPGDAVHLEVARWLAANTPADALVMAGNIGYIGYFSERRIFDSKGLASPAAYRALATGRPVGELLALARPDYLALDHDEYDELRDHLAGYRLVFERRHPELEWLVYRILARNDGGGDSARIGE